MKKLYIFLFILITVLPLVLSEYPNYDPNTGKKDYSDPTGATGEEIGQALDSKNFPEDRLKDLTADKLITKGEDGKYNLYKVDAGKLNKEEYAKALDKIGRSNTPVEADTKGQETHTTSTENGFEIDKISYFAIDEVGVYNGEGISYENNQLKIDRAETIQIKDGLLSGVTNFSGNTIEFSVGEVKNVINKCVSVKDAKDSRFIVSDEKITIKPNQGVNFSFTDCSYTQSEFLASSNNSELSISKDAQPTYTLREGKLTCKGEGTQDKLGAQSTASVNYGTSCFECMSITPVGSYYYNDPLIEKDFVITIPKEGKEYRLCLKKSAMQEFALYDGLVDYTLKTIQLNGIVQYKRYPIKNGKINGLLTESVFFGKSNVSMSLKYLPDFTFIDALRINGIMGLN